MFSFPPEQRISCEPRTEIGAMKMKSFVGPLSLNLNRIEAAAAAYCQLGSRDC